jgi:nitroreductase
MSRRRERDPYGKLHTMETWDAIRARRNVRAFADTPIDGSDLERILEAARRTPSSMNQQAWDFVLVTDRAKLGDLSRVWRYGEHVAGSAATIALVAPATRDPDERETIQFDLGQAAMSVMLAATDLGIGTCHSAVGDLALARDLLGLPKDRDCMWLIALGYPRGRALAPIERPDRRAFDDLVHRERWAGPTSAVEASRGP